MAVSWPITLDTFADAGYPYVDDTEYIDAAFGNKWVQVLQALEAGIGYGSGTTASNPLYSAAYNKTFSTLTARFVNVEQSAASQLVLDQNINNVSTVGPVALLGDTGKAAVSNHAHAGVYSFMGRLGSVTLGVADIGSVFTGFGQILVGTGLGTGKVLPASTVQGYTLVAVSTAIDPSGLQWQQADWLSGDVKTTTALVIPEGWLDGNGQAVSRSVYSQLCASTTIATTGLMTHGNSVISSIPSSQVVFMAVGQPIESPGQFPSGTTVTAILSSTSISVSNNATGTGGTQPFTVFPNGNGDGSTTFNVINMYDKVPVGWSGGGGYGIGQSFGSASTVLSQSQLPSHGHVISQSPHNHANNANTSTEIDTHTHPFSGAAWQAQTVYLQPGSSAYSLVTSSGGPPTSTESESQTHYHNLTDGLVNANVSINLTGGSAPVSLYQPSVVVRYLVKT